MTGKKYRNMIVRLWFYIIFAALFSALFITAFFWMPILWALIVVGPLFLVGIYDILQKESNILRNYPVWGHWRYTLLRIRPQIQAYFIETEQSGRPFSREMRMLVYQRANQTLDTMPFGTQRDVHEVGYEWVNHSIAPKEPDFVTTRVMVGGPQCTQPHSASRFNISAMSFGAISQEAVRALNRGAKIGGFHHDTGEGGLSKYHLMEGGDLVWEIGSGYFGCRTPTGAFDPEQFREKSRHPHVKMVEIKISQGAKPSHGAILPGIKVTPELAEARGVKPGVDCLSPLYHSTFSTPIGLLQFVQQIRELSGGKPAGFKLCIGVRSEFLSICKAMLKTGIYPDFIVIDGSEGGTGAAPVEFSDFIGVPLNEGLIFVHNCLVGIGLRQHIRLIASGKIISGFDITTKIALGADICNSARGMMFALGCVQSRRCHANTCPTGVTTQDPARRYALDVDKKAPYVAHYQRATLLSFLQVLGATGCERPEDLQPSHIHRRVGQDRALTYEQIFHYLKPNALLDGTAATEYLQCWNEADASCFHKPPEETHRAESHCVERL